MYTFIKEQNAKMHFLHVYLVNCIRKLKYDYESVFYHLYNNKTRKYFFLNKMRRH